jgi:hypothetical protein
MTDPKTNKAVEALLVEVEALCKAYIGKKAEGEQWAETCARFARLDRLAKKVRKAAT